MEKNIANELKKLDVEIAKKLFSISKDKKMQNPPSPLQGRIMEYLIENQKEDIYQKDLEKILEVRKATVSGALLAMEKNNLIQRITSEDDARNKKIILTNIGIEKHKNMKKVFDNLNEELTKNISEKELEQFYTILEKMKINIQK